MAMSRAHLEDVLAVGTAASEEVGGRLEDGAHETCSEIRLLAAASGRHGEGSVRGRRIGGGCVGGLHECA
jgi:hypothetical protein